MLSTKVLKNVFFQSSESFVKSLEFLLAKRNLAFAVAAQNSYRGIDNCNFAFGTRHVIFAMEKHGNYELHGEWYRNGTEYCPICNSSSKVRMGRNRSCEIDHLKCAVRYQENAI